VSTDTTGSLKETVNKNVADRRRNRLSTNLLLYKRLSSWLSDSCLA